MLIWNQSHVSGARSSDNRLPEDETFLTVFSRLAEMKLHLSQPLTAAESDLCFFRGDFVRHCVILRRTSLCQSSPWIFICFTLHVPAPESDSVWRQMCSINVQVCIFIQADTWQFTSSGSLSYCWYVCSIPVTTVADLQLEIPYDLWKSGSFCFRREQRLTSSC